MARVIGLDVGHHAIKASVYSGRLGRLELEERWTEPCAPGQADALGAALQRAHLRLGGSDKPTVVAALGVDAVAVRTVVLPFTDRKRVAQTLASEVENQVPFELDDMILDDRVLSTATGASEVLVALAPKPVVAERLSALEHAGLDPKLLVLDGDLLGHASRGGVQVVVDVGERRTIGTLCRAGEVVTTRGFATGSGVWTEAIADHYKLPRDEAERLKHESSLPPPASRPTAAQASWDEDDTQATARPRVGQVLQEALDPWLAELRATLVAFEDAHSVDIDEVVLGGGGSLLGGLPEHLEGALGVPVRRALLAGGHDDPAAPLYLLSDLLARRGAGMLQGASLEFRKDEFVFKGDLRAYRNWIGAGIVGATTLLVGGLVAFGFRSVQLNQQIEELDRQISSAVLEGFPGVAASAVATSSGARAAAQERLTTVQTQVEALQGLRSRVPPTLAMLQALSEAVPPAAETRLDVTELVITDAQLTLDAETDGYEAAAKVEAALQANQAFAQAKKSDERKVKEAIAFTIHIPLQAAEGDAASAAGEEG